MSTEKEPTAWNFKSNLRAANTKESRHPHQALEHLKRCLAILEELPELSPSQQCDFDIIARRVIHLENRLKGVKETALSRKRAKSTKTKIQSRHAASEITPPVQTSQTSSAPPSMESTSLPTADLSNDLNSAHFSFTEFSPLPDVVEDVYDALLNNRSLEYDDYLTLFESVNDLYPNPIPPLIEQESDVAFYIGDTHGALKDTQTVIRYFERLLARLDSSENKKRVKIIFLGDYVDRNPNDLENLALIVAFWLKYPQNVVILRGNHEDMKINQYYGFLQNLQAIFVIEDWVKNLYQEILAIFMKLPIIHINRLLPYQQATSSTEDGLAPVRIFAVHAGIPVNPKNPAVPLSLEQVVKEINPHVSTYEQFDTYMNWLLWADPREEVDEIGLLPDIGRNQYGKKPFDRFMAHNDLQFMVRAHEVLREGFKYFFNQRLISLFTASTYKNRPLGKAAFLRLEVGKSPVILTTDEDMLEMDLKYWN